MEDSFSLGYPESWKNASCDMPPDWYAASYFDSKKTIREIKDAIKLRFPKLEDREIEDAFELGRERLVFLQQNALVNFESLFD